MSDKNGAPKSFYKNFSTQTLESMLRDMTLSDAELDMELLDCVLSELDSRQGAPSTMAPEDALKIFEEEYSGNESIYLDCAHEDKEKQTFPAEPIPSRRKKSWKRPLLIAAAVTVLVIGTLGIVGASSPDMLGNLASWTRGQFGFGNQMASKEESERAADAAEIWPPTPDEEIASEYSFDYDNDQDVREKFGTLKELLDTYHVAPEIDAPAYMPEGFHLVELKRSPTNTWMYFYAFYEDDNGQNIAVCFDSYGEGGPTTEYEKTDDPIQIVDIEDISFHAFSNTGNETVAWITKHFECTVSGKLPRNELLKIAESIYFEVD